jgi:hypothetical protein
MPSDYRPFPSQVATFFLRNHWGRGSRILRQLQRQRKLDGPYRRSVANPQIILPCHEAVPVRIALISEICLDPVRFAPFEDATRDLEEYYLWMRSAITGQGNSAAPRYCRREGDIRCTQYHL